VSIDPPVVVLTDRDAHCGVVVAGVAVVRDQVLVAGDGTAPAEPVDVGALAV
jgi:hypothetical protein